MESNQIHVKQSVERELMLRTSEMEKHICEMFEQNRKAICGSLMEACETITPYEVQDMKRLLESQKAMIREVLTKNAQLRATHAHVFHARRIPGLCEEHAINQAIISSITNNARLLR
jgi:hypothetical protein